MTAPALQWQKSFGGSGTEVIYSVDKTADGGYILMGNATNDGGDVSGGHGEQDIWVVKTDATGTLLWQRMLGGTSYDIAESIISTADGGYIIAGSTSSDDGDVSINYGSYDVWIVKLNSNGTIQWQKSLGGSDMDHGFGIRESVDGGYVLVASTYSTDGMITNPKGQLDSWLVKLDGSGNPLWQKILGGTEGDALQSIANTPDGGYILAGNSSSNDGDVLGNHGGQDVWVVKVDGAGNIQWQESFGGSLQDAAEAVAPAIGGGYYIGAHTVSGDGDVTNGRGSADFWLIKINDAGNLLWQRPAGSTSSEYIRGMSVTSDGGAIMTGGVNLADGDVSQVYGNFDAWLVRFSSTGDLLWEKNMGSTGNDASSAVIQTTDGGFLVGGYASVADMDVTESFGNLDFWLVKLDAESALSVNFGVINASRRGGQLRVDWDSESETNCLRYDIEASADGQVFKKIGSVNTKADGGNSATTLHYSFTRSTTGLLSGVGFLAFLFGCFKRRSWLLKGIAALLFFVSLMASCRKTAAGVTEAQAAFIRIAQVDIDGSVHYSTVVKVVTE
ncbi:hypothetical protein GCM10027051_29050 [Niabella terrae]